MKINREATSEIREKTRKTRITINLDSDMLAVLRAEAQKKGVPYQSYANRLLRKILDKVGIEESRLDKLEKEIAILKKKIAL